MMLDTNFMRFLFLIIKIITAVMTNSERAVRSSNGINGEISNDTNCPQSYMRSRFDRESSHINNNSRLKRLSSDKNSNIIDSKSDQPSTAATANFSSSSNKKTVKTDSFQIKYSPKVIILLTHMSSYIQVLFIYYFRNPFNLHNLILYLSAFLISFVMIKKNFFKNRALPIKKSHLTTLIESFYQISKAAVKILPILCVLTVVADLFSIIGGFINITQISLLIFSYQCLSLSVFVFLHDLNPVRLSFSITFGRKLNMFVVYSICKGAIIAEIVLLMFPSFLLVTISVLTILSCLLSYVLIDPLNRLRPRRKRMSNIEPSMFSYCY